MLIYAKFSCIFQSPILVDTPWSVPKLVRTNMASTYQFNRFKDSTPMFGFWVQVAWTYVYKEYRHPEHHPNFSHIAKLRLSTCTQVLSLSTHNKYP